MGPQPDILQWASQRFDAAIDKVHQMDEADYPKIEKRKARRKILILIVDLTS